MISLQQLNQLPATDFVQTLAGIFEHSPWVAEAVLPARPFADVATLYRQLCDAVDAAGDTVQMRLIRAHPELASKAAIAGELTAASNREQRGAGLQACTPEQFKRLQSLNNLYGQRFGFPFIIAVKGHTPDSIIAAMAQRVTNKPQTEQRQALQQIYRIARFRLEDLVVDSIGNEILARADELARFSDIDGGLTCAYLTAAHQNTALQIRDYMLAAGLDTHIDAVGNVVGRLAGTNPDAGTLLTGSHYDTVSRAGRFDGRLGILLPIAVASRLRREGTTLPFTLEIIAFAEEEGLRFKSTFLGSSAVAGCFDAGVLDAIDAAGMSMREALVEAGHLPDGIGALARNPADVLGFIEVHIEQGPVLLHSGLGVGIVTGIAGSRRSLVTIAGQAGHSGTVPMSMRRDAAAGAAEIVLLVESRCSGIAGLVGTVGQLRVPDGAMNVIPGNCELSIDLRSVDDSLRLQAGTDIDAGIAAIAARRKLDIRQRVVLEAPAVQCTPRLQQALGASVQRVTGSAPLHLPSGAGHDAMMMARLTEVGMLFVRCGNGGISHHPDEIMDAADASLAGAVFSDLLLNFKADR
jgi:allantoate deiminase/N-carbamoyl-L-amino-acid hydrolase